MVDTRISGEDGLDIGRVGEVDERAHRSDPEGERLAVAPLARAEEPRPAPKHQSALNPAGQPRTRRQ